MPSPALDQVMAEIRDVMEARGLVWERDRHAVAATARVLHMLAMTDKDEAYYILAGFDSYMQDLEQ